MMTDAYFANGHSIEAMLEAIFKSDFFKEESAMYARIKSPAEMVVGAMRLAGPIKIPSQEIYYAQGVCSNMGQGLLRPPSVEGWQGGDEWINTGTYVERINFATRILNAPNKQGIKDILGRIRNVDSNSHVTADDLVNRCLDVLGPISVSIGTEAGLKTYASKFGDLSWDTESKLSEFEDAALAVIRLIVCTQEYQTV